MIFLIQVALSGLILFFSDGDSYKSNKNICCFCIFVFAWVREGLAEKKSEYSVSAFLSHGVEHTCSSTSHSHTRDRATEGRKGAPNTPALYTIPLVNSRVEIFNVLEFKKNIHRTIWLKDNYTEERKASSISYNGILSWAHSHKFHL